jgi:hypothetical protein
MGYILLEAIGAGLILVLIVWWTMFSGRSSENQHPDTSEQANTKDNPPSE